MLKEASKELTFSSVSDTVGHLGRQVQISLISHMRKHSLGRHGMVWPKREGLGSMKSSNPKSSTFRQYHCTLFRSTKGSNTRKGWVGSLLPKVYFLLLFTGVCSLIWERSYLASMSTLPSILDTDGPACLEREWDRVWWNLPSQLGDPWLGGQK